MPNTPDDERPTEKLIIDALSRVERGQEASTRLVQQVLLQQTAMQGTLDLHAQRLTAVEQRANEANALAYDLSEKTGTYRLAEVESERRKLETQASEYRSLKRSILGSVAVGVILSVLAFVSGLVYRTAMAESAHRRSPTGP